MELYTRYTDLEDNELLARIVERVQRAWSESARNNKNELKMAQSATLSMPVNGTAPSLTEEDRRELEEYQKIVHFRDVVFTGTHRRIKLLEHMKPQPLPTIASKPAAQQPQASAPAAPAATASNTNNKEKDTSNQANGAPKSGEKQAEKTAESIPGIAKANNPDINPIFLEKGPALIKAEMKIRRAKIERALKEQVEKALVAAKPAAEPSVEDAIPDFDINEVLAKGIEIARSKKPVVVESKKQTMDARNTASDSFDDNTFYSSEIPSSHHSTSSMARRVSGEVFRRPSLPFRPLSRTPTPASAVGTSSKLTATSVSLSAVPGLQELGRTQPLNAHVSQDHQKSLHGRIPTGPSSMQKQHDSSRENFYNNTNEDQGRSLRPTQDASNIINKQSTGGPAMDQEKTLRTAMDVDYAQPAQEPVTQGTNEPAKPPPSRPLSIEEPGDIRTFNLSPVAPQPVRVSPLATAKAPAFAQQSFDLDGSQTYTPLQGRPDGSTGNSSGQDRQPETQKGKRKLSTGKSGPSRPTSPYIKPEPLSPSPFHAAPLPRPHKRQRQVPKDNGGLNYDEPQEDARPLQQQPQERQPRQANSRRFPRQQRDGPHEVVEIDDPQFREPPQQAQHRRVISQATHAGPPSPRRQHEPFPQHDQTVQRNARPASRMVIDPYATSPAYQSTPALPSARRVQVIRDASVSPAFQEVHSPAVMAPPPRMEQRLVQDEYGNRFYASIPVVPRQSMVPQSRVVEQDYIYDRPPPRAMPRQVQHFYGEDGIVFKREPAYEPRRVISLQDDHIESPVYRQRAYSVRPLPARQAGDDHDDEPIQVVRPRESMRRPSVVARAPVDDYVRVGEDQYVRVMPPPQRQMSHFEPQPQIIRLGSVRPEQRYGAPEREYVRVRAPSIHPDAQTPVRREFAASVRPDEREGEAMVQNREYSARPADGMGPPRREYIQPQAMDEYQPVRRVIRRDDGDIEYVSHQNPIRQVDRRQVEDVRYAPRGELEAFEAQPQYQPRRPRQVQQEIYEDEQPPQVVYR